MSAIRSRDNRTEVALRKSLHALGLRYRLHSSSVFGRPDLIFSREKVAVFVDGDYWHARLLREKGPLAVKEQIRGANQEYWLGKFARRMERDDRVTDTLQAQGWIVLRYWESEVKRNIVSVAADIQLRVSSRKLLSRKRR
jgi:DNA mismatch endonuclease, patch repair protein